jgi:threonine synthase
MNYPNYLTEKKIYEHIPIYGKIMVYNPNEMICGRCGKQYSLEDNYRSCLKCNGPLLLDKKLEEISGKITKNTFNNRARGVWRYLELLPKINRNKIVSLGEGGTALLKCERLAQNLGLRRLLVKDETTNPTGSFLDRGMTIDISKANELGLKSLRCLSVSGNFAASASAYASRAGFSCTIQLSKETIGKLNLGKLYQIIAYGGNLHIEKQKDYDAPNLEKSYILSSSNPYFAEGEKTSAYEICEQLQWRSPDRIIVPMGHGENISMIWRGIKELGDLDLIPNHNVMMTGVQIEGHASLVDRLQKERVEKISAEKIKTIATDLVMKDPSHGDLAIRSIRESKGSGVQVNDSEILDALSLLARTEGIFAEPAAASTIAGLKKLIDLGQVDKDEEIVCIVTGAGLKDPTTARKFIKKVKTLNGIISQIESKYITTRLGRTKFEILKIISSNETYGYEVWRNLKQRLGVEFDISSIYQHLAELENAGLIRRTKIESVLGKPKRYYYSLTDRGVATTKSLK